jgi:hypothetical protein
LCAFDDVVVCVCAHILALSKRHRSSKQYLVNDGMMRCFMIVCCSDGAYIYTHTHIRKKEPLELQKPTKTLGASHPFNSEKHTTQTPSSSCSTLDSFHFKMPSKVCFFFFFSRLLLLLLPGDSASFSSAVLCVSKWKDCAQIPFVSLCRPSVYTLYRPIHTLCLYRPPPPSLVVPLISAMTESSDENRLKRTNIIVARWKTIRRYMWRQLFARRWPPPFCYCVLSLWVCVCVCVT